MRLRCMCLVIHDPDDLRLDADEAGQLLGGAGVSVSLAPYRVGARALRCSGDLRAHLRP